MLISAGMQASLEKCPWLRKVSVQLGERPGNTNLNKGTQPDKGTWLFFNLYFTGFHKLYNYLVLLGGFRDIFCAGLHVHLYTSEQKDARQQFITI